MNDTKTKEEARAYCEMTDKIPYVLFINAKGEGFTLNRGYKLLHDNIGGYGGLSRCVIAGLRPLAVKVQHGYLSPDPNARPSWVSPYRQDFVAYWFNQDDPKVRDAFFNPVFPDGATKHYDTAKNLKHEIKVRKAEQRAEITREYRKEFGVRKPFLSDGMLRFYLSPDHSKECDACRQWNDGWWSTETFTNKELDRVIADITKHLQTENVTGTFYISLEGQYQACTSFEEAEAGMYEPWGDYFSVNEIVTIVI